MTRLVPLLALLVASCLDYKGSTPATEPDRALVGALVEEWRAAGLPYGDACEAQRAQLRTVYSGGAGFRAVCAYCPSGGSLDCDDRAECPWGCAAGCVGGASGPGTSLGGGRRRHPILAVTAAVPADRRRRLLIHEAGHWLDACSGLHGWRWHQDERVWAVVRAAQEATRDR
jgi:hypothetical protein